MPLAKYEAYIPPSGGTKHHLGSSFKRKKQSDSDQAFRCNCRFTGHRAEEPAEQCHRKGSAKFSPGDSTGQTATQPHSLKENCQL